MDSAPDGEWKAIVKVSDPPFLFIRLLANMLNSLTDLRPVLVVLWIMVLSRVVAIDRLMAKVRLRPMGGNAVTGPVRMGPLLSALNSVARPSLNVVERVGSFSVLPICGRSLLITLMISLFVMTRVVWLGRYRVGILRVVGRCSLQCVFKWL